MKEDLSNQSIRSCLVSFMEDTAQRYDYFKELDTVLNIGAKAKPEYWNSSQFFAAIEMSVHTIDETLKQLGGLTIRSGNDADSSLINIIGCSGIGLHDDGHNWILTYKENPDQIVAVPTGDLKNLVI